MGISGWFATFFVAFLCYTSYHQSLKHPYEQIPDVPKFLVPVSTGKQRNLGGGNRDASMYTQSVRRKATVDGYYGSGRVMKETTHTTGSSTGVVEVFVLSDVCVRTCKKAAAICAQILEGGTATDEFCDILDGMGDTEIDGGNAETEVC